MGGGGGGTVQHMNLFHGQVTENAHLEKIMAWGF